MRYTYLSWATPYVCMYVWLCDICLLQWCSRVLMQTNGLL